MSKPPVVQRYIYHRSVVAMLKNAGGTLLPQHRMGFTVWRTSAGKSFTLTDPIEISGDTLVYEEEFMLDFREHLIDLLRDTPPNHGDQGSVQARKKRDWKNPEL